MMANDHVHPIFRDVLAAFVPQRPDARADRLDALLCDAKALHMRIKCACDDGFDLAGALINQDDVVKDIEAELHPPRCGCGFALLTAAEKHYRECRGCMRERAGMTS